MISLHYHNIITLLVNEYPNTEGYNLYYLLFIKPNISGSPLVILVSIALPQLPLDGQNITFIYRGFSGM